MKLITTNDGVCGWIKDGKVYWAKDKAELARIGYFLIKAHNRQDLPMNDFTSEVDRALDTMAFNRHDLAEFGVFGGFMFSSESEAA